VATLLRVPVKNNNVEQKITNKVTTYFQ